MCVLDCAPNALKMLHNSTEFMPYVIFIGAPGMEQLKQLYSERRINGGSQRNLSVRRKIQFLHFQSYSISFSLRFFFSLIAKVRSDTAQDVLELSSLWHPYTK